MSARFFVTHNLLFITRHHDLHRLLCHVRQHHYILVPATNEEAEEKCSKWRWGRGTFPAGPRASSTDSTADVVHSTQYHYVWRLPEPMVYVTAATRTHIAEWRSKRKYSALVLFRGYFVPKYSRKTPHWLPWWAINGVSFVSSHSNLCVWTFTPWSIQIMI